jgi:hypothetical protein
MQDFIITGIIFISIRVIEYLYVSTFNYWSIKIDITIKILLLSYWKRESIDSF